MDLDKFSKIVDCIIEGESHQPMDKTGNIYIIEVPDGAIATTCYDDMNELIIVHGDHTVEDVLDTLNIEIYDNHDEDYDEKIFESKSIIIIRTHNLLVRHLIA